MSAPNQFLGLNELIAYPLVVSVRDVALNGILADLVFRFAVDLGIYNGVSGSPVVLATVTETVPGTWELVFEFAAAALSTWSLVGVVTAPERYQRVSLELRDGVTPVPASGYGLLHIGDPDALPSAPASPGVEVDERTVRLMESAAAPELRVANAVCLGPTLYSGVVGAPAGTDYKGRVAAPITGCVEVTVTPEEDQESMIPDIHGDDTFLVDVPLPSQSVPYYADGATSTITTRPFTDTSALPVSTYDSVVDTGPVASAAVLSAGANVELRGTPELSELEIGFRLGAGTGISCAPVPGCDIGVPSVDVVKSINGAGGSVIKVAHGATVDIVESPGDHKLYVVINSEKLTSVAT